MSAVSVQQCRPAHFGFCIIIKIIIVISLKLRRAIILWQWIFVSNLISGGRRDLIIYSDQLTYVEINLLEQIKVIIR